MKNEKLDYEIGREDIPLLELNNIFVGNLVWINKGIHNDIATFDLVVREMPKKWNFYVFYGLKRFINIILNYNFSEDDVKILKEMNLINSTATESFYKKFKFTGDVWAMKDGTIFFPSEPIVRITAPVCEANIFTSLVLNAFGYPTRLLTKSLRVKLAIRDTVFIGGSIVRLPGFEQGVISQEIGYILNSPNVSPFFYKRFSKYQKPTGKYSININHAFIKSFKTERSAYRYALDVLVSNASLMTVMTDTYNFEKGLDIFIEEIKKTKNKSSVDPKKFFICIDSGDLLKRSFYARKVLDKNNLVKVGIQVMSSLDEYKIDQMIKEKAPINIYTAATEVINISDNPSFEAVYKMAELRKKDGTIEQKAKLTKGKESYPGRKQIFRRYKDGKMIADTIGLDDEKLGEPLLHKFIKKGKLNLEISDLNEIKIYIDKELQSLPEKYKRIDQSVKYPVLISGKLGKLLDNVKKKHII
ncbi:MAG: hypothetical protein AAB358_00275 [Patescibacteria group bacterium]